jgi:hypothetical protein
MAPNDKGSRPVPDPTILTTEQLHREIASTRELVVGEIRHLSELTDEKFRAVEDRFRNVDDKFEDVAQRTAEQKTDTKDALDAALQAAKDAVALQTEAFDAATRKSESAVTKQIDALGTLVEKSSDAKDEKINDLKSRLDRIEATATAMRVLVALSIAAAGLAIAFVR